MKHLKTFVNSNFFPNIPENESQNWQREAVRAVVFDSENSIALLYVGIHGYHKLPGGGIEKGESPIEALRREIREEVGCDIEVLGEIGQINENRVISKPMQINYCFYAKVAGEKGVPDFDDYEKERGFDLRWYSFTDAIRLMESEHPDDAVGKYVLARDLVFLREAKEYKVY